MTLLTITAAAARVGISVDTLREYERAGLIHPQRTSAGHRLYGAADIETARRIVTERRAKVGRYVRNPRAEVPTA
ncbi:MAG TPA: MerR family DNA-binding transcriptional regulator [Steroidobacteraceae bacterium]|jgi:DNA-binding transcriptional MerR regulator|nr:MerR family DNA-binding transcriptional regulator [Steroidobacteraceae bacterium]